MKPGLIIAAVVLLVVGFIGVIVGGALVVGLFWLTPAPGGGPGAGPVAQGGFETVTRDDQAQSEPVEAAPAPKPLTRPPEEPARPASPNAEPEALPEVPKADPKSSLKQLLPDVKFYLETLPDGRKRLLFPAEVCLREGILEVFLCKTNTKEHEAILRSNLNPKFIHAALIAIGAKPGTPVQFVNPKTQEAEYKPATGHKITVTVHYRKDGRLHTHPAQEWIFDQMTKKPMAHHWVFAGSRFLKNPDLPDEPEYYTANNGEVISISNFVDSMLEVPVEVSRENASLYFTAMTARIPPQLSQVWVILEPEAEKK